MLDVTFGEDVVRIRTGHGAHNFAVLRQSALNLLKQENAIDRSIRAKYMRAAFDDVYLLRVLCSV